MSTHLYSQSSDSRPDNSLSNGALGAGVTAAAAATSSQQPSFSASSSSLPGALGIGDASSANLPAGHAHGWTLSNGGNQDGSQWNRSNAMQSLPHADEQRSNLPPAITADHAAGQQRKSVTDHMQFTSSDSLPNETGVANKMESAAESTAPPAGRRPDTAGGTGSNGPSSSMRNFLVPIGATGARQKLSILSASQRPKTSQPVSSVHHPNVSSHESRSGLSRDGNFPARMRNVGDQLDHQRSASSGHFPSRDPDSVQTLLDSSLIAPRQERIVSGPSATLMGRSYTSGSDRSKAAYVKASTTPTQERPNPLLDHAVSPDWNQADSQTAGSTDTISARPGSRSGFGRRLISREKVLDPDLSNDPGNTQKNAGSRSATSSRPGSSSGRERAAKLGAGFKNMFSTKSPKDQSTRSPTMGSPSLSPSASSNSGHQQQSSLTPPKGFSKSHWDSPALPANRGDPSTSPSAIRRSPEQPHVDLSTAQSAGWTALHPRSGLAVSAGTPVAPPGHKAAGAVTASSNAPFQDRQARSQQDFDRAPEQAPSIAFDLPSNQSLFDGFTSESFFAKHGAAAKGSPTSGLNLTVAGESFTTPRNATVQENPTSKSGATSSDPFGMRDKSLPPTPDPQSSAPASATSSPMPTRGPFYSEGASSQQRSTSNTSSATSQSTILGQSSRPSNRLVSLNSSNGTSRRGSAATTQSESDEAGNESTFSTAKRSISSAKSTSEESSYSAPNSSRTWSPSHADKPSVPITSPLLASLLSQYHSQHSQHQQQILAEGATTPPRRIVTPSSTSVGAVMNDSSKTTSPTRSGSPSPLRPDLPAKSRDRTSHLQHVESRTSPIVNKNSVILEPLLVVEAPKEDTAPATKASSSESGVKGPMYVPPDALTYTRKGTAVRPMVTKIGQAAINNLTESITPHALMSNLGSLDSMPGPVQSRFSTGSSDVPSAPSSARLQPGGDRDSDSQFAPMRIADAESFDEETSLDAVNLLPSSAWTEVEAALTCFKPTQSQSGPSEKGGLLRSVLLPFLALEAETPNVEVSGPGEYQSGKMRRSLFFEWIQYLLLELQTVQSSADRGAILESIACIIESRNFSAANFRSDEEDEKRFYSVFGHILNYAIGELNKKGVYQNTLIFSGRLLAVAFFRIRGVASKLLRALPVNRFALERIAVEANWEFEMPRDWDAFTRRFPPSLHKLCYQDARSYLKVLDSHSGVGSLDGTDEDRYLVHQPEVQVEMSGNWLRRWQSDDSELFFSFCRSYHRQLSALLTSSKTSESARSLFFGGPGYAHLATCIHQKCLSLVHRDILSVTTLSSQKNFNPGETANVLSGSTAGKPRHLEAANRRCTAIVVDVVRAPSSTNEPLFGPMLGIHIKCLIKRTSLYDVQGVFCLLDWLEGVMTHMEGAELAIERLVDIEFVIHTISLLLKDADHALALMRTIAFCYSNFAVLTSTSRSRIRFCEDILLHPMIFQKLFLSWSFTIRAYFLHLLVFRLARINDFAQPEDDPKGKTAVSVARLFNQRLDEIRKRHDELSPSASSADSASDDDGDMARFKTRPQSFVSTIKQTPSASLHDSPGSKSKAERVLGIGMPDPALSSKAENKAQSRAAKWLRALGGKGATKGMGGGSDSKRLAATGSPLLQGIPGYGLSKAPTVHNEARRRMPKLDEYDLPSDNEEDDGGGDGGVDDGESDPGEDGGDETPRAEGVFEFSFEARDGHPQSSQVDSSLADLSRPNGSAGIPDPSAAEEAEKSGNEHISSRLSFDLQSPSSSLPPQGGAGNEALLAAPGTHNQARVSRAFSRRQSILPGPAFSLFNHESESEEDEANTGAELQDKPSDPLSALQNRRKKKQAEKSEPYAQNLHIYAVQSLREYEQTVQEHDDFFAKQGDSSTPQVPRLPIQWPAMWTGE